MISIILFASAIAYFLGSINTSIIVSKLMGKSDIRTQGSGNAGATNTLRVLGKGAALVVVIGDFLKGALAILVARFAFRFFEVSGNEMIPQYFAALSVIVGHIYPVFFGFRGGKGIMTSIATVFMLDWEIAVILLLIFITIFLATRYVSLGSCVSSVMYPVLVYMFHSHDTYFIATAAVCAVLAVYKHRSNIQRLIRGTESKTYFKK
ncbi:MAG: glycerol-3-phosphate 1-O-acyltransferase PlsY [Clostridia bacterium]|nr:glycerol-3-phosphate 1-O-acyltransferase PlsY [Clostridia bacterium]